MDTVLYFRIRSGASERYLAAASVKAAIDFLTSQGLPSAEDSLESVTEQEASQAEHFREFAQNRSLCMDGTYSLGTAR